MRETGEVVESILSESMMAAWVRGNEQVLKVAPDIDIPPGLLPPTPPGKTLITPPDAPEPIVRFPVIEKAAERLHDATIVTPQEFRALDSLAREKAFTITTRMTDNSIDQIRELLSENIARGADREAFISDVQEMFKEGLDLSEARIEGVFRNNVNGAFSDGQENALNHILVRDAFPYRRYSATRDQRVRPEHFILETSGLNGTAIYRADDPVWQLFRPPWDWLCRCSGSPVSIQSAARGGVREAIEWLARAEREDVELFATPPQVPEFVDHPTFEGQEFFPPPEWIRGRPVGLTGGTQFSEPIQFQERARAPVGGISIGGKQFRGGEFIPGEVLEEATPEERAALEKPQKAERPKMFSKTSQETSDAIDSALSVFENAGAKIPRIVLAGDSSEIDVPGEARALILRVNPSAVDALKKTNEEILEKQGKPFVVDDSLEGVILHETTHLITDQLDEKAREAIRGRAENLREGSREFLSLRAETNSDEFLSELAVAFLRGKELPVDASRLATDLLGISREGE